VSRIDRLQLFSNIFTRELHLATKPWAFLAQLKRIRLNVTRRMFTQWLARRVSQYRERRLRNCNGRSAFAGFDLFESLFDLLDLRSNSRTRA